MNNKYKKIFIALVIVLLIVDAFVINIVGGRGSLIVSISFIAYIIIFEIFKNHHLGLLIRSHQN